MKTSRWVGWIVLVVLLLSALPAVAGFGTFYRHYMYGYKNYYPWYSYQGGSWYSYYYIDVPANAASLVIETGYDGHGGYGDCDLYLRYGALPTSTVYHRRSAGSTYKERITYLNPPAGRWYLKVHAYSNYRTCYKRVITPKSTTTYNWRTDMLNRVNYYRGQYGRSPLYTSSKLQLAAQNYATDMAVKHYYGGLNHVGSTYANYTLTRRLAGVGYSYYYAAENIAWGYTSVAAAMTGWWNSSGHRANILNSAFTQAGFGYAYGNDSYRQRWVQCFGRPR